MSREMKPRPEPPADETRVTKVVFKIGGRRWEHTHTISTREITAGPAEVIEITKSKD
jgi:hypothetical protein